MHHTVRYLRVLVGKPSLVTRRELLPRLRRLSSVQHWILKLRLHSRKRRIVFFCWWKYYNVAASLPFSLVEISNPGTTRVWTTTLATGAI